MSTRAQIAFEGTDIKVYQHSDGYPGGVLPTLLPFVADFMKHRGYDEDYVLARYLMRLGVVEEQALVERREDPVMGKYYSKPQVLGHGIDLVWHGDIEYAYLVRRDGSVNVQRIAYGGGGVMPDKLRDAPDLTIAVGEDASIAIERCG